MGRKERRRDERKNRNVVKEMEEELDVSIKFSTFIKIIIVIGLILFVLYYILAVFVTKEVDVSSGKGNTTSNSDSVANSILASNIFNQVEGTYFVYFYDFGDEDENIKSVIDNRSDLTIYRVNTKSGFNSKYVTNDSGNRNVTSVDNLKVKSPTLMEITNDKVTLYLEGSSSIISFLNG